MADAPLRPAAIRAKVVCLLVHNQRTLWIQARDDVKDEDFLFPPGGGVEFGETLRDALRRELLEELHLDAPELRFVDFSENIFQFNGRPEHELVFVFTAEVPASPLTAAAEIEVIESNGERLTAAWYTIDDLAHGRRVVYPDGVLSLVRQVLSRNAPHSR